LARKIWPAARPNFVGMVGWRMVTGVRSLA
jgi:hypothetical protein